MLKSSIWIAAILCGTCIAGQASAARWYRVLDDKTVSKSIRPAQMKMKRMASKLGHDQQEEKQRFDQEQRVRMSRSQDTRLRTRDERDRFGVQSLQHVATHAYPIPHDGFRAGDFAAHPPTIAERVGGSRGPRQRMARGSRFAFLNSSARVENQRSGRTQFASLRSGPEVGGRKSIFAWRE